MTARRRVAAALALLALAGCSGADGAAEERVAQLQEDLAAAEQRVAALEEELAAAQDTGDDEPSPGRQLAGPRTPDGLVEQLNAAPDAGQEPAVTAWRPADVPAGFARPDAPGYDSPGALVHALAGGFAAAQLGTDLWELTVRVLDGDGDEATAAVLTWGLADDAVAGTDLRLYLARDESGWYVDSAEERVHCRRGVRDDLCV